MSGDELELYDERIWLDGCWDFFHHGHAGAMLQARQLGSELYVGVHSDEDILSNKGPTVMDLDERYEKRRDTSLHLTYPCTHKPAI